MICKVIHVVLVLLYSLILTRCQIIQGGSCEVQRIAENDLLMKVRELQMEVSSCKEKSLATERLMTSRLAEMEIQLSTYRNESHEKQRELESELQMTKDRLKEVANLLDLKLTGKHIRVFSVLLNINIAFFL